MTRFVVVGTLRRGALDAPELLDENNEALALSALPEESRDEARVLWRPGREPGGPGYKPVRREYEPTPRVERMMRLATGR